VHLGMFDGGRPGASGSERARHRRDAGFTRPGPGTPDDLIASVLPHLRMRQAFPAKVSDVTPKGSGTRGHSSANLS
jgi:hypothetical protein